MSTETADPVAAVLATAVRTLPEQGRRWPGGPVTLGGEYKAFSPDLEQYLDWVAEVESTIRDSGETAQRIRMLHYGRHGSFPAFDTILNSHSSRLHAPLSWEHASQETLDGLVGAGSVSTWHGELGTRPRPAVELSHVWVCADAALNGLATAAVALSVRTDPYGAMSWTGDLASWWRGYNRARKKAKDEATRAGREWTEPTDPASQAVPLGWLDAAAGNCAADDMLGDMDGILLMPEFEALDPSLSTPLTDLLRGYYGPSPAATGTAPDRRVLHSDNRFHLFVRRARPAIPHTYDVTTGTVTLTEYAEITIAAHVRSAAEALQLAGREFFDDGLASPWGKAMMDVIAIRFAQFLRDGLAADGWTIGSWPVAPRALDTYGAHPLRLGDSDADGRYGGIAHGEPGTHVRLLQQHLTQLGFPTSPDPVGSFGPRTASALREFQISARFARVHKLRLDEAGNPVDPAVLPAVRRYHGRINGCLNPDTATLLKTWLTPDAKGLQTRNAATVDAYRMQADVPGEVVTANLWHPADETDPTLGVYATDHLERHPIPAARRLPGGPGRVALGRYAAPDPGTGTPGGPVVAGAALWPEAALTPQSLIPPEYNDTPPLPRADLSTYRVIRAVAEAGGGTHFDAVDASGADRLRLGPLRWSLGVDGFGDLAALLAYYQFIDPTGYRRDLGRYGIWPAQPWWARDVWSDGAAGHHAREASRLALYGLRDAEGRVHPHDLLPLGPTDGEGFDHLQGWHAVHRLVMTLRTTDGLRRAMWRFAVRRINRLRQRSWRHPGSSTPTGPLVRHGTDSSRDATLGEVFTSEQAVAALLRWHTVLPEQVLGEHGAADGLRAVFHTVYGPGPRLLDPRTGPEADWAQAALTAALVDLAPADPPGFGASVAVAASYAGLSPVAGSFQLALLWPPDTDEYTPDAAAGGATGH
ncbi:peptidoglycan-binding domain-containing protein [Micromonospora gifhornensis]|uniref:peptidoglycan-binding domain-containing protein n=1 Tax=Micromonospora gifhornensis TaxID=84594 RepID=UPI0034567891